MTAYHGGKQRIGKQLAEVIVDISMEISEDDGFKIKGYCEPFCGMLGVYRHIPELFEDEELDNLNYRAGDTNGSVIAMWKAAQKGWKPPKNVSEAQYDKMKWNGKDSAAKGFVGHQYAFGGQWFNGYSRNYGKPTSAIESGRQRVMDIAQELTHVGFQNGSYTQYSNLNGFVIYCDPPYANTKCCYNETFSFNTQRFWEWCEKMSDTNLVFVSSYTAPRGIECVFTSTHKLTGSCTGNKSKKRIEKLYLI